MKQYFTRLKIMVHCCILGAGSLPADISTHNYVDYDPFVFGWHTRGGEHWAGAYKGHCKGRDGYENPLQDRTDTIPGVSHDGHNVTFSLDYVANGFGATKLRGVNCYTVRGDISLEFISPDGTKKEDTLEQGGTTGVRTPLGGLRYDGMRDEPEDVITIVKGHQLPEADEKGNAGGFVRLKPIVYIKTQNSLDDDIICACGSDCDGNSTKLHLAGWPKKLSKGKMALEVESGEDAGKVIIKDGDTVLIDGSGRKEWPLSENFRKDDIPAELTVYGKSASSAENDVTIWYKFFAPGEDEPWTEAKERLTVFEATIRNGDGDGPPEKLVSISAENDYRLIVRPAGLTGSYDWEKSDPQNTLYSFNKNSNILNMWAHASNTGVFTLTGKFKPSGAPDWHEGNIQVEIIKPTGEKTTGIGWTDYFGGAGQFGKFAMQIQPEDAWYLNTAVQEYGGDYEYENINWPGSDYDDFELCETFWNVSSSGEYMTDYIGFYQDYLDDRMAEGITETGKITCTQTMKIYSRGGQNTKVQYQQHTISMRIEFGFQITVTRDGVTQSSPIFP